MALLVALGLGLLAVIGLLAYAAAHEERAARAASLRRLRAIAREPEQEAGA